MANHQLIATEQQRDLGITLTKDLKWQKPTEKSCKTANRVLGFIAHNFNHKRTELMLPPYKSLVRRPPLEYAVQGHLQRYLRIRISTKWDFTATGAREDKINYYQYI